MPTASTVHTLYASNQVCVYNYWTNRPREQREEKKHMYEAATDVYFSKLMRLQ